MAPLETLIEDHLTSLVYESPYIEVGDLLLDENRTFIRRLASDIRELWDDLEA